MYINTDSIEAE